MSTFISNTATKSVGASRPDCDIAMFGGMLNTASLPGTKKGADKFHGDIHSVWMFYNIPLTDIDFFEQLDPLLTSLESVSSSCDIYCFRVGSEFLTLN